MHIGLRPGSKHDSFPSLFNYRLPLLSFFILMVADVVDREGTMALVAPKSVHSLEFIWTDCGATVRHGTAGTTLWGAN